MADNNLKVDGKGKSLREVLSQKYVIDYFQREYKWEKKHIEQLIYDLDYNFFENYKAGDSTESVASYKSYFMGPYIVYQEKNTYSLVDGQQRLTSLTLLLIFLYKHFEFLQSDVKDLIYPKRFGKESYNLLIEERIPMMDWLFKDVMDDNVVVSDASSLNLLERYSDIEELFPARLCDEKVVSAFCCWLMDKVSFVEIQSYSTENAYTIFETMNDRGANLTSSEMLKSFLLSKVENDAIRVRCNDMWRANMSKLGAIDRDAENDFFRALLRGKYANPLYSKNNFETIGTSFHRWAKSNFKSFGLKTDEDIARFVGQDLAFYIDIYKKIRLADHEVVNNLEGILVLGPYFYATSLLYPLYMAAVNITDTEDEAIGKIGLITKAIDCFVLLRLLNGDTISQSSIRDYMCALIDDVRGGDVIKIKDVLSKFVANYTNKNSNGLKINAYPYKFLRYFHYRVNLNLAQYKSAGTIISPRDLKGFALYYLPNENAPMTIVKQGEYKSNSKDDILSLICRNTSDENSILNMSYNILVDNDTNDLPSDLIEALTSITDLKKRANYLYKFVLKTFWQSAEF